MLIQEYISKDFPAFEINAKVEDVLQIAEAFVFTHIFVKRRMFFWWNL
jgi:hypothetical protein